MVHRETHRPKGRAKRAGFTLIELAIVVFLLGVVAAMAVPRLLPVIAFSELEGSARHLAGFGQGAMAHSSLLRERVVVRIDLKEQQVYAVHWILPEQEEAEALAAEGEPDQLAKLAQLREKGIRSPSDMQKKFLEGGDVSEFLSDDEGGFDAELAAFQMNDRFNAFSREALEVRAANVKHDESFLDGVGDIFGEDEIFDLDAEEPVEEELADPILRRMGFPGTVVIAGIEVDGEYISKGTTDIEFSVLGLAQKVVIFVENEDDDAFTVYWDPIAGRTRIYAGRETDL